MRFLVLLLVCLLFSPLPAFAGKREDLQRIEATLKKEETRKSEFAAQEKDIEGKLSELRKDLVSLAHDVQMRERALLKIQKRAEQTQADIQVSQAKLEKEREALAHVIMALQRISRMPPQMLLARPAIPIDTARSFHVLQEVIPNVSKQAAEMKNTLEELATLTQTLASQEAELKQDRDALVPRQAKLESTVSQRQKLLEETRASQKKTEEKSKALAAQAKDLRDLLTRLDARPADAVGKGRLVQKLKQLFSGEEATLPVAGNIKTAYGERMSGGGESQGVTIESNPGAIVVSPSDGTVRFAGAFRQYKLLVIIQHANGEHSLLGGLQEIYTRVGDTVIKGEPIGKLSGDSTPPARLYYERRHNGKPIDPRAARG